MAVLDAELRNVRNPALGAVLLWQFTVGYEEGSSDKSPVPLPLIFIVLPMLLQPEICQLIISTQKASGLRSFVAKFGTSETSKNDVVLEINERARRMRPISMQSLRMALTSSLVALRAGEALVFSLSRTPPKVNMPETVRDLMKAASRLGYWCASLSLYEVSTILKVSF